LDRQEKGKDTNLSAIQQVENDYGIRVVSIVTLGDVLEWLQEKSEKSADYCTSILAIQNYREAWGI
jgi:orotate phosphoribosyltransferase